MFIIIILFIVTYLLKIYLLYIIYCFGLILYINPFLNRLFYSCIYKFYVYLFLWLFLACLDLRRYCINLNTLFCFLTVFIIYIIIIFFICSRLIPILLYWACLFLCLLLLSTVLRPAYLRIINVCYLVCNIFFNVSFRLLLFNILFLLLFFVSFL